MKYKYETLVSFDSTTTAIIFNYYWRATRWSGRTHCNRNQTLHNVKEKVILVTLSTKYGPCLLCLFIEFEYAEATAKIENVATAINNHTKFGWFIEFTKRSIGLARRSNFKRWRHRFRWSIKTLRRTQEKEIDATRFPSFAVSYFQYESATYFDDMNKRKWGSLQTFELVLVILLPL